ncbi:LlaJI family restriction endonuclease [Vibrio crassostreae]|uniref:LlaJI family restriction endonuclease n=1 Tax=Vibrio crassostreae TaxID=246167 RepID=UPI00148B5CCF|nr:LlaJI family restriction endonuclease [Vibrio crassostreae]NOI55244.1 LlaJI family restriction endonuclease [Vibrio crassostreae]
MWASNILYLSDRLLVNDQTIPESLLCEMRNLGLVAPDMVRIHFCGVISYCDGLAVFLPRNHEAGIDEQPSAAHLLLQALLKYYQSKDNGIYAQESGEEVIGGRAFSLAVSLLNDYRANSLYVRRVKERLTNNGKVNWPRTIARSTAYPTKSGPMYLELSTSRSRYISNCETAKIHAQVIKELFSDYGMLWFGQPTFFDECIELMPLPTGSVEVQLAYLQRELQVSYSERDMFLIKSLIQYLRIKKGINTNNVLIGVRKFHNLWESMLDACLIGKYAINSKLPVPVYQTAKDEFIPVAQKGQRTDTVLKHPSERRFAVVDAKYYEASSAGSAPGWSDLVKQFFYQKAVRDIEGNNTPVSNHFIFPGCSNQLKAAHVAKRDVTIESQDDCLGDYSPIYCHYQPPITLLSAYVNNEKLAKLTDAVWIYNKRAT